MVLGQVLLEEALQHRGSLCCSCTLKKTSGVIAASEPRGCPDCCTGLSTLCLLWALAVPACCREHWARAAGAGLSLFAGGAPCSSWKNALINLSPRRVFPTVYKHLEITLRKPECCRTRMFPRPSPWMKFSALEQRFPWEVVSLDSLLALGKAGSGECHFLKGNVTNYSLSEVQLQVPSIFSKWLLYKKREKFQKPTSKMTWRSVC